MRKVFCVLLCLCFVAFPARAEEIKYAALTFDDGPSGRFTRRLLDGLDERGVKCTFFLCGYRMAEYPQETQRILDSGHEVGCHGYSHKPMQEMSRRNMAQEIMDTEALLPAGCRVSFLRPPGGCCSENVQQVAQVRNLSVLTWSVDPRDWATDDKAEIVQGVLSRVEDGDVILLHDMSDSSVDAALEIIDRLTEQGYRFTTVSNLAAQRGYLLKAGKTYCRFPKKVP